MTDAEIVGTVRPDNEQSHSAPRHRRRAVRAGRSPCRPSADRPRRRSSDGVRRPRKSGRSPRRRVHSARLRHRTPPAPVRLSVPRAGNEPSEPSAACGDVRGDRAIREDRRSVTPAPRSRAGRERRRLRRNARRQRTRRLRAPAPQGVRRAWSCRSRPRRRRAILGARPSVPASTCHPSARVPPLAR